MAYPDSESMLGAAAVIPILDPKSRDIGWYYLPIVLLSSVLALAVACLTNNVQRRYPLYWWEPPQPAPAPIPVDTDSKLLQDQLQDKRGTRTADIPDSIQKSKELTTIQEVPI